MTPHIEAKKEDIAPLVLMPGDPRRAKYIADKYLENAKEVNTIRNENAYTGYYKGVRITVFSSGMGVSSMGIYSYELFNEYDVEVIIRIGSCGSYTNEVSLYDLILVKSAYSSSNYDKEIGLNEVEIESNSYLNDVIKETSQKENIDLKEGKVHTTLAFYNELNIEEYRNKHNCLAVEMECYSLFLNALKCKKKASSILTVSDSLITKEQISSKSREQELDNMIKLALESIINL